MNVSYNPSKPMNYRFHVMLQIIKISQRFTIFYPETSGKGGPAAFNSPVNRVHKLMAQVLAAGVSS